jgi:hypothetical protein
MIVSLEPESPEGDVEKSCFIGAVESSFSGYRLIAQKKFFSRKILFLNKEIH